MIGVISSIFCGFSTWGNVQKEACFSTDNDKGNSGIPSRVPNFVVTILSPRALDSWERWRQWRRRNSRSSISLLGAWDGYKTSAKGIYTLFYYMLWLALIIEYKRRRRKPQREKQHSVRQPKGRGCNSNFRLPVSLPRKEWCNRSNRSIISTEFLTDFGSQYWQAYVAT